MSEPTLNDMDDYNGNESPEKRSTINKIVIGLLILGAIYSVMKYNYSNVDDYVGTPEKPGLNTAKNY